MSFKTSDDSLTWKISSFAELTTNELYDILQLRSQVFVVEQDCVYQDLDANDKKAIHVYALKSGKIIAYSRIFNKGEYFPQCSIGRVVLDINERKYGYGHQLMHESIKAINKHYQETEIKISAQKYLIKFYQSHGFIQIGEEYLEDGIPHVGMIKQ